MLIVGVVTMCLGLSLLTAGVLALSGRAQYLEWREVNAPAKKRRGGRREDRDDRDDEDDDRPRRRRRDDDF
jgi:hypothetical protein